MNVSELMKHDADFMLVVKFNDLKEIMLELIDKVKKENLKDDPLYTTAEFAELLHVDRSTINRWVRAGVLKKTTIGGRVYYRKTDLHVEGPARTDIITKNE